MIQSALIVSLKVTFTAAFLSFITGVGLARLMTHKKFKYKGLIEVFIMLPVFLPPSVVGYLLLILMGKNGIVGSLLYGYLNFSLIFTWQAAAVAAFIVSFPMMYQSAKGAFLSLDPIYEDAARVFGANEIQVLINVTIPMTIKEIISGLLVSFGRAFGEFGATLMVAGNIQGKTQTLTTAMYYAVESSSLSEANKILFVILAISFTVIFILNYILKSKWVY